MFKLHNIWVTSHSLHTEQKIFTFCPVGAKYSAFKPSDSYLPGGLKNYSTQKVITYSDSTRKIVQENVFGFYGTTLNLVTKVAQTFPKSDNFFFRMQIWKCLVVWFGSKQPRSPGAEQPTQVWAVSFAHGCSWPSQPSLVKI